MNTTSQEMKELAYQHLREGYFEDAVEAFSKCILADSNEAKIYYGRGVANFQLKRWKLAIADFKKAKELYADDPENCMALAMSLAIDNKIYEAIDCYEALLAKAPRLVRAHIQLAMLYYRIGVISKGHQQLDIALTSRPSLTERRTIEDLKKEQLTLDKRRFYKPDFEELRQLNQTSSSGFLKKIKSLFNKI